MYLKNKTAKLTTNDYILLTVIIYNFYIKEVCKTSAKALLKRLHTPSSKEVK